MQNRNKNRIEKRKSQHISITLRKNVNFRKKSAGFEFYDFDHNALPEINENEINTEVIFLNKKLNLPFMISGMTGGFSKAEDINRNLAILCEEKQIAMGVGSQRQTLDSNDFIHTFKVVRKFAPTIPVIGNIGAVEIAQLKSESPIQKLIEMIKADAIAIHLNPLQEFLQPEGNTNFKGVQKGIELLVKKLDVPVIVKEVGSGISYNVAKRLFDSGVKIIDTAGAGGTSWAGIEILRRNDNSLANAFWDWGIPTTESILNIKKVSHKIFIIASGGIRSGIDMAKSIALGASLTAAAAPMIKALNSGGVKSLVQLLQLWETELRGVMFLVGAKNIQELKKVELKKSSHYEE